MVGTDVASRKYGASVSHRTSGHEVQLVTLRFMGDEQKAYVVASISIGYIHKYLTGEALFSS